MLLLIISRFAATLRKRKHTNLPVYPIKKDEFNKYHYRR